MRCLSAPACFTGDPGFLLGRIAVLRTQMRSIVTDGVTRSVGQSVCHDHEPCKNRYTDRDAVLWPPYVIGQAIIFLLGYGLGWA